MHILPSTPHLVKYCVGAELEEQEEDMEKKTRNCGEGVLSLCMLFLLIFQNLVVPVLSELGFEDDQSFLTGSDGNPLLARSLTITGGYGAAPPYHAGPSRPKTLSTPVGNCGNPPLVYSPPPSRSSGGGRRGGGHHHNPPSSGRRGGGTGGYSYPSPPLVPTPPSSGSSGGGTGGYSYPSPQLVPTPPSGSSGGSTGGYRYPSPPLVPIPPSRGGGGGYRYPSPPLVPVPPSRGGGGGYSYPSPPLVPIPPSRGGGGSIGGYSYPSPPSFGGGGGGILTPPTPTPIVIFPPTTPIGGTTPTTPPYYPITEPFPGTCNFWRTHPAIIFGLLGWFGTIGAVFGVTSLPGLPSNLSLLQALSNTRDDGIGQLYREGTASLLNSMVSHEFPYTTQQVKNNFLKSLGSNSAAAAQARLFKAANGGHFKP